MAKRNIPKNTDTFIYYTLNPKGKSTGDCVIRALGLALDKDWDTILDELVEFSHKYKLMINDPSLYNKYLVANGYVKLKQPKQDDNTKYTGKEFCREFYGKLKGLKIVAHLGTHHTVAIVDGKVHDTWDSTNGKVGNIWVPSNINLYED